MTISRGEVAISRIALKGFAPLSPIPYLELLDFRMVGTRPMPHRHHTCCLSGLQCVALTG